MCDVKHSSHARPLVNCFRCRMFANPHRSQAFSGVSNLRTSSYRSSHRSEPVAPNKPQESSGVLGLASAIYLQPLQAAHYRYATVRTDSPARAERSQATVYWGESHNYPTSFVASASKHAYLIGNRSLTSDGARRLNTNPISPHPCVLPFNSPIERATPSPPSTLQISVRTNE
jgi:hypothetical protein